MTDATFDPRRLVASGAVPPAAEQARRARRWGWWYQTEAWLTGLRAWFWSTVLYSVGQPLLYMIAMGVGLGSLVDRNNGLGGVPYLWFVAPAILVSTVAMSVGGEMTYPIMGGFKWDRLYYGPAATPMQPGQIGVGHFVGVMIRFAFQSAVFWLVMLLFGAAPSGWSFLLVPIGVLSAAAMGAPLQAFSANQEDEGNAFSLIQRFIIMPMFLFAGTFFPLESMPAYLRWIGWISPVWHGTQLARQASYGMAEPLWLTLVHVAFLLGCTVVGLVLMVRAYTRRLGA